MKLPELTTPRIAGAVILVGVAAFLLIATPELWHRDPSTEQKQTSGMSNIQKNASPDKTTGSAQSERSAQPTTLATEPSSPACKQFTLPLAREILGNGAALNTQDSAVVSETADMLISSCVYRTHGTDTVRLSAYLAKTSLGQSPNIVVFGSDRPAGVRDIPGYGQASFWDAHTGMLSVLKNNNRYDISRSSGNPPASASQDEVLRAATVIVPKL
jgi:hypothetical protein